MKKIISILLIICTMLPFSFLLSSCTIGTEYRGEHLDLYTEAVNSVLWNLGHSWGADFALSSDIEILETDEYGRTLYAYIEENVTSSYSGVPTNMLLISQFSDEENVYYYEDVNYIVLPEGEEFTEEQIQELKDANDWNKELNLNSCISVEISNVKQELSIDNEKFNQCLKNDFDINAELHPVSFNYKILTISNKGDSLFYAVLDDNGEITGKVYFIGYLHADGTVKMYQAKDLYNYKEQLIDIKTQNGWYD